MLTENLQLMKYVGKQGNANPHFLSDWVEVELPETINNGYEWNNAEGKCTFASAYELQIFTGKIYLQTEP